MPNKTVLLITNFPDEATAARIATDLLNERLIACVNIMAPCRSLYRWQGKLQDETETPAWFKTTARQASVASERLAELHPYDVPEVLVVQPKDVHPAYQTWVHKQTREQTS